MWKRSFLGCLVVGCSSAPVIVDDPVLGPPVTKPGVTLSLEVPATELEALLDNLVKCTAKTFGPFHESPTDPSSAIFSITCHVTDTRERGIKFNCTTSPNSSSCTIDALYDERVPSTCTTPGGKPISFHVRP